MSFNFLEPELEPGGQFSSSYNNTDAAQAYDDNYEIQQYHQDIRNHYAQQTVSTQQNLVTQQNMMASVQPNPVTQQAYAQQQTTEAHVVTTSGSWGCF